MDRTPTFTPDVHLAFLRNSITGEMFIAPAIGETQKMAESNLREAYPSAAYSLLAMYPASDVQRYLVELNRWPGLPSKPQPKLSDLLATQRIKTQVGGLPPLNRTAQQQTYAAGLNAAQIEQVRAIAKGMPSETQALAARLLAAPQAQPMQTAPVERTHPFAPRPAAVRPAAPQSSLKDALAAMRAMNGIGATVQHSTTPAPKPLQPLGTSVQAITRSPQVQPSAANLSPSALPPSARGTMTDAQPEAPSAFAVGKVSAISVLKALRQH